MKDFTFPFPNTTHALMIASALTASSGLGADWVTWEVSAGGNGHSYLAVPASVGLTWNVAYQRAQAQGGYLATITSAAENDFVFSLINSSSFFTAYNGSGPAIGGYNAGTPSNPAWSWVTGEPFTYSHWAPGQPDYANYGPGPEDRLEFFGDVGSTPANTWNDLYRNDDNIGGYVVEVVPEPGMFSLLVAGVAIVACLNRSKAERL